MRQEFRKITLCHEVTHMFRTTFSWVITQRVFVIPYRRFETTYWSHLQGSRIRYLTLGDGTNGLSRNIGKELPLTAT